MLAQIHLGPFGKYCAYGGPIQARYSATIKLTHYRIVVSPRLDARAIRLDAYCELNGLPLRVLPYRWQPSRSHDETIFDHIEKLPKLAIQWAVEVWEIEVGGAHDACRDPSSAI